MVVREGSNVTLQCKAKGYPEPYVMWRREDGTEMLIGGEYGKSRVDPGTQIHMASSQTDSTLLIRTHASAIDHLVHPSSAAVFDHIECFAVKLLFKHSFQSLSLPLTNPLPPGPQIHCWPLVHRRPVQPQLWSLTLTSGLGPCAVNAVDGELLHINKVSRLHMTAYLCVASNGVPPSISKRVQLRVQCKCATTLSLTDH